MVLQNQKVAEVTKERANGDEDGGKGHRTTTGVCIDLERAHAKFFPPHSPVQFSSVAQSCLTLWDPIDCSTPALLVHQKLPEFTQTHVH